MWKEMAPAAIEKRSMEIIRQEMADSLYPEECLPVVERVIHTSADFDFARTLFFSPDALPAGQKAIAHGIDIVTDTNMAAVGINKRRLSGHGGRVLCHMAAAEVVGEAKSRGITRATVAMEKAVRETPGAIFVIGNAPTALLRLCELIESGEAQPALVVGVPVGFVNVPESKERIMGLAVPQIVARGRKGGSPVAAAIINALLYMVPFDHA